MRLGFPILTFARIASAWHQRNCKSSPLWRVNGLDATISFIPQASPLGQCWSSRSCILCYPSPGGSEVSRSSLCHCGHPVAGPTRPADARQTGPFCRSKAPCVSSLLGWFVLGGCVSWTRIRGSASALSFCPSLWAKEGGKHGQSQAAVLGFL